MKRKYKQIDGNDVSHDVATGDNTLLAYMAGQGSDMTSGDIQSILEAMKVLVKKKESVGKANKSQLAPSTITVFGTTYYLNMGQMITFQGSQYFVHMTMIPYHVSQHNIHFLEKALVDCGANVGI
jgi:protein associated with RNAse G/E